MRSFQRAFGGHLRQLRNQRGYTQEELAHIADINPTYLSGIERGVRNPTLEIIRTLASALGITVSELFAFETRLAPADQESDRHTPLTTPHAGSRIYPSWLPTCAKTSTGIIAPIGFTLTAARSA